MLALSASVDFHVISVPKFRLAARLALNVGYIMPSGDLEIKGSGAGIPTPGFHEIG